VSTRPLSVAVPAVAVAATAAVVVAATVAATTREVTAVVRVATVSSDHLAIQDQY